MLPAISTRLFSTELNCVWYFRYPHYFVNHWLNSQFLPNNDVVW